jgi:hypothetical protein
MVAEVWLHIGSAKSGTSSLQKHFSANAEALADQGLAYITTDGRRATINELVISYNKRRDDLDRIRAHLTDQIAARPERVGVLSSEMLFGFAPDTIFDLLPILRDKPLTVLAYLRRQDRYIEAVYLQKSKNFRFLGSLDDYIAHFNGSGSDYLSVLQPWIDAGVRLVPRVMERPRLAGGSVVPDALAQIGLPSENVAEERDTNVSPGLHRVQLLQAAAKAGIADPRKLQRTLAAKFPQAPKDRAPVMTQDQRRAYLDRFRAGNEVLRARFFPEQETLFDETDLAAPDQEGIPPFTPAQLQEIERLFQAVKAVTASGGRRG